MYSKHNIAEAEDKSKKYFNIEKTVFLWIIFLKENNNL